MEDATGNKRQICISLVTKLMSVDMHGSIKEECGLNYFCLFSYYLFLFLDTLVTTPPNIDVDTSIFTTNITPPLPHPTTPPPPNTPPLRRPPSLSFSLFFNFNINIVGKDDTFKSSDNVSHVQTSKSYISNFIF